MEWLGTIASILILLGWFMDDIEKIRMVNIIGSILFILYAIYTRAFSVGFLNFGILVLHIYKLLKLEE